MAPRRRPSSTRAATGRRPLLIDRKDLREKLVARVSMGAPLAHAAASVGVGDRTLRYWLEYGRDEAERLADAEEAGQPATPDPALVPYLDLYEAVQTARAEAAVRSMAHLQKAAAGGFVTEETTETRRDGTVVTTVKTAGPDWRAAAWYLERSHRDVFGKDAERVELTGPGGGAVQVGGASVEALADRLATNIAALTAAAATAATAPQLTQAAEDHGVIDLYPIED